jgi:hypothetical protein
MAMLTGQSRASLPPPLAERLIVHQGDQDVPMAAEARRKGAPTLEMASAGDLQGGLYLPASDVVFRLKSWVLEVQVLGRYLDSEPVHSQ